MQSSAGGLAASAAAVQTNLYNKLTSAIGERGYGPFQSPLQLCVLNDCYATVSYSVTLKKDSTHWKREAGIWSRR